MDSCIRAIGGKSHAIKMVGLDLYIPICDSNQYYVEPFCYSAVMFFNVKCRNAILNDYNDMIYNFWNVIKTQYTEFEKELEFVWIGKKWYDEFQKRTDPVGKAVFFYMDNKQCHAGILEEKWKWKYNVKPLYKELSKWKRQFDDKNSLSIWNLDFREVFSKLEEKGGNSHSFVYYLDPPYVQEGEVYNKDNTEKTLKFNEQDHKDLFQWFEKLAQDQRNQLILSYDDHPLIRDLYSSYHIKEIEFFYGNQQDKGKELLISNRPLVKRSENRTLNEYFNQDENEVT